MVRLHRAARLGPALAVAAIATGLSAQTQTGAPNPGLAFAVLQGLDKVTARISTFEAPIDKMVRFGTLEIVVRHCRKTPPEEPPESTAFLEIEDVKEGEAPILRFRGWMFASSPALSALEHPIYDVWVVSCRKFSKSGRTRSR